MRSFDTQSMFNVKCYIYIPLSIEFPLNTQKTFMLQHQLPGKQIRINAFISIAVKMCDLLYDSLPLLATSSLLIGLYSYPMVPRLLVAS